MTDIRIPGVTYGGTLSYEEREKLENKSSTDMMLNVAAQTAGCLKNGQQVHIHGDDATYGETVASQNPKIGLNFDTYSNAVDLGEKAIELGSFAVESGTLGEVLGVAAEATGVATLPLAAYSLARVLPDSWAKSDERAEALNKDMMHLALESCLALPAGYKAAGIERRHDASVAFHNGAQKIGEAILAEPGAKFVLQVRCDEGMHAAEQFAQSGRSLNDFMKANQSFGRRFQLDPAFRAGFDAMEWARKGGEEQLRSITSDLHGRDARLQNHASLVWAA